MAHYFNPTAELDGRSVARNGGEVVRWLLLWSVLLALWAAPAAATFPGYNGRIAFQCEEDICLVNADGNAIERLVSGYLPAWSPDGRQLAFARGYGDVFVVAPDGRRLRQVLDSPEGERGSVTSIHSLTWSRDGKRLMFVFRLRLTVLNLATGIIQEIGDAPDPDYAWAPDDRRIAFTRRVPNSCTFGQSRVGFRNGCAPDRSELWLMDSDGTNQTRLADPPGGMPDWSPDGQRILYTASEGTRAIHPDGTPSSQPPFEGGYNASWSPDGTQVVLVDREAYIRVADADGEDAPTAITGPWGSAGQPVWQPLAEIASLDVRRRASRRRVLRRGLRATVHCAQSCQIAASLHDSRGAVDRVVDAAPTTGSRDAPAPSQTRRRPTPATGGRGRRRGGQPRDSPAANRAPRRRQPRRGSMTRRRATPLSLGAAARVPRNDARAR